MTDPADKQIPWNKQNVVEKKNNQERNDSHPPAYDMAPYKIISACNPHEFVEERQDERQQPYRCIDITFVTSYIINNACTAVLHREEFESDKYSSASVKAERLSVDQ
jgi:hypothetical protein